MWFPLLPPLTSDNFGIFAALGIDFFVDVILVTKSANKSDLGLVICCGSA